MASERKPSLAEVIRRHAHGRAAEIHTSVAAVITAFDANTQKASCKPLVMAPYLDESDERQVETQPIVTGVPVQFLSAGGFTFTVPIKVDETTGTLFFFERSHDKWLSGDGKEVDPEQDNYHDASDAVFFPGLLPFGKPLSSCPTDHATAGSDTGVRIHFRDGTICIGDESGSDFVALAAKVMDRLDKLQQAHDLHKHTGGTISGNTGVPDQIVGALDDVAASQAKAK